MLFVRSAMSNQIMPSGTNGSYHNPDMLELRGIQFTSSPSNLPTPFHHTEAIENKDDKEACDTAPKIDTEFYQCTFTGRTFIYRVAKKARMLL